MAVFLWRAIPVLLIVLMVWCLYSHLLRLVRRTRIKHKRSVALGVSLLVLAPACNLWSAFYPLLLILHFCVFTLVWDAVDFIVRRVCKGEPRVWGALHAWLVLPLLSTALLAWFGYMNIRDVRGTEYTVATAKPLPAEGCRIGLLADVHYGLLDNKEAMQGLADSLSGKDLDFVVICGDLTDERSTLGGVREICRILGGIKTKHGVYYVFGNHDTARYSAHADFTREDLVAALQGDGITILQDDIVPIGGGILLAGRIDRSFPRPPVQDFLKGADTGKYIVLADHQPYELAEKAAAGVDLQLSGHTHSGQVFPVGYICSLLHIGDLNYGQAAVDGMQAVVTSGITGWGAPFRTQGRSEYVIINVQPE